MAQTQKKQGFKNEQQNDHTRLGISLSICNAKKSEEWGKNINRVSILNNIYLPTVFQLTGVNFFNLKNQVLLFISPVVDKAILELPLQNLDRKLSDLETSCLLFTTSRISRQMIFPNQELI